MHAITDIDAFEYEDILKQPTASAGTCEGYTLTFQNGKSPHTTYPFSLHDTMGLCTEKWHGEVVRA